MATFNRQMLHYHNFIFRSQKAITMSTRFTLSTLVISFALFTAAFAQPTPTDTCESVRYLMENDITPYDLDMGGGVMGENVPVFGEIPANHYADFWSFTVTRPTDTVGNAFPVDATLRFENASEELEFALFRGMVREFDFVPLTNTDVTFNRDDTYTIIVRRTNLLDETPQSYTLTLSADTDGQITPPEAPALRNESGDAPPPAALNGGQLTIDMPTATVTAHADAINVVHTRQGASTQVYFPNPPETNPTAHTLHLEDWADELRFLAGDMALSGTGRTYFLENYGYEIRLEDGIGSAIPLSDITYADNTQVTLNWDVIQGIWVFDDCVGFKLNDGRTFVGATAASERFVSFTGTLDAFTIAFDTDAIRYQVQLNWVEIRPDGAISYNAGVFDFPLIDDRQLTLQSSNIQLNSTAQTDVRLADRDITLTLDWTNMQAFTLQDESVRVQFTDEPRASVAFERSAVDLQRFEALNDTIRISYHNATNGTPGEERLLLPGADGYVEIITPAGFPAFDGRVMPDTPGYIPRGLNNTGANCYPVNTILPEVNCPPNGEVNPANGNLFYAVEDMAAYGGELHLNLTRSYNSRLAHLDGPFGAGWATPYRLDYIIPFDDTTGTRPITPEHTYRVGLDVTWAPRGIVTFITPSGSQHQFVSNEPTFESGTLTAVTMPGWTLFRESTISNTWTLEQVDGLTYTFDRAGRLLRYTNGAQTLNIAYPRDSLTGPDSTTANVVIRDDSGRELRLAYNDDGHIVRSVLASATTPDELVTEYTYTDGLLTGVIYPNGTEAAYTYHENGYLLEHNDPHAPIHPHMRYTYDDSGNVETIHLVTDADVEVLHRTYAVTLDTALSRRETTVTDEINNRREYSYRYTQGFLKEHGESYTLAGISNPLTEIDSYENRATFYQYNNSLMIRTDGGPLTNNEGRGAVSYEYNAFGQISCIACRSQGLPPLEVIYQPVPDSNDVLPRPLEIRYANGTTETFTYNDNGQIATHTDTNGAVYRYEWADGHIAATIRQQDGEQVTYTYNDNGQVTSETRTIGDSTYTYDWLGRISTIQNPTLGTYTIAYNSTEMVVTDPAGIRTAYLYDSRDRLVEVSVEGNTLLSLTTYAYDIYDRLTEETQWLIDNTSGIPITTTYDYERRPTIPPLTSSDVTSVINGTQITVTQPGLGQHLYSFDAVGRLRRAETPFERTYYDHFLSRAAGYQAGLRIQQRTLRSGDTTPTTTQYYFDNKRQLREVRTERQQWEITLDEDAYRQSGILPRIDQRIAGLQAVRWEEYVSGVPTLTDIRHGDLPLNSRFSILNDHNPTNTLALDFARRLTSVTDGNGNVLYIAYCPLASGAAQEIYTKSVDVTCDTTEFDLAITYDAGGRLLEAVDELGTRTFTYTPQPESSTWQVTIVFSSASNQTFSWNITYDGLGRPIRWQDANGFERVYTYDTLGRLTAVTIENQPENSFTFRYNDANQVIEETDGLGRGFLYRYNEVGQVINRLDKSTADTLSYSYTPDGQLETVITSDGNVTTYRYENTLDPTRLTGIIEPTGNEHQFNWNDATNTLIYTNPRNQITRYGFDGNGLLWRIEDPLTVEGLGSRTSELHYNDAGNITTWIQDSRQGNLQSQLLFEHTTDGTITVSERTTGWTTALSFGLSGKLLGFDGVHITYDPLGRLATITSEENAWTLTREDGAPSIVLVDGAGGRVDMRYDALFRRINETQDNEVIRVDYTGSTVNITRPDGTVNTYVFSAGDTLIGTPPSVTRVGTGFRVIYRYTPDGLLNEIRTEVCSSPDDNNIDTCATQANSVRFSYDKAGRPLRITDADGNFEAFTYNESGSILTYQTENGHRFHYVYDEIGRLRHITSPTGIKLILQHNTLDRVTGICRAQADTPDSYTSCATAGGVLESYTYDALGRVVRQSYSADSDTENVLTYTYGTASTGTPTQIQSQRVNVTATYTNLGRTASIQTDSSNQSFSYDGFGRVVSANDVTYQYNALDRVIQAGTLNYNITAALLTVFDNLTGQSLTYAANTRGNLSSINTDLMTFEYPTPHQITIERLDGTTIQQTLNRSGEVQSIGYGDELLLVSEAAPSGHIQRQVVTLPGRDMGYAVAIGYDDDNRPLTMRVTDTRGLRVLYTQTFTYNDAGLPIEETRRYQDNTLASVEYEYTNNQLDRRIIQVSQPINAAASGVVLLLGLVFIMIAAIRTRSIVFARRVMMFSVFLLALEAVPHLHAQQNSDAFTLDYVYDITGNLESIIQTVPDDENTRVECARYDYDGMNRLVRVRLNDITGNERQINYTYDAFNRLISTNDNALTYDGNRLLSVGQHYFTGVPFATVDVNNNITWLYTDGRQRIVAAVADGDELSSIWLFDPLNRYIALDPPTDTLDACQLSGTPGNIPEHLALQPYSDSMIWDTRTNLYLAEGRAYAPEPARHLQRDTQGPDALGHIYASLEGRTDLPRVPYEPVYGDGLEVLRTAQAAIATHTGHTAEDIAHRFDITPPAQGHPLAASLLAARAPYTNSLERVVNLPKWLQTQYNLPAPARHPLNGTLTAPAEPYPARGGTNEPFTSYSIGTLPDWSAYQAGDRLYHLPQINATPQTFRAYVPWTIEAVAYQNIHQLPTAPIHHAPNAVIPWLPKTLESPADAAAIIAFAETVTEMPHQPNHVWVDDLLNTTLPTEPQLPPESSEEWLQNWFTNDTFGIPNGIPIPDVPPSPAIP